MLQDLTLGQSKPSATGGDASFELITTEGTDPPPLELGAFRDELTVWQRDLAMAEADSQIAFMQTSISILSALGAELATAFEQRNQEYERLRSHVAGLLPDLTATRGAARDGGEVGLSQPDAELIAEIVKLRDQVESVKRELTTTSAQKSELSVQLRQYKVELEQLSPLVVTAQSDLQTLHDDKVDLEQQVSSRLQELRARDAQIAGLEAALNLEQVNHANLKAQLAERATELDDLHKLTHEAEETVVAQQEELSAMIAARADLDAKIAAQDETISGLEVKLDEASAALAKAKAELEVGSAQINALTEELSMTKDGQEKMATTQEAQIASLTLAAAAVTTELHEKNESLEAATAQSLALQNALNELTQSSSDLQNTLQAARVQSQDQLHEATSEREQLYAQATAREQEVAEQRTQIAHLEDQLAMANSERVSVTTAQAEAAQATAWTERLPALAEVGAALAKLPASKTVTADAAIRAEVLPVVVSHPQNFSDVEGVGPVFEERLYKAGIGTYWELAHLSDADLMQILAITQWQLLKFDLSAIRASALELAEQTATVGRLWAVSKIDNLGLVPGIGEVYEQRLYDAGIYTYEALGNATVEQLSEICHTPRLGKHNFLAWIEHAREFQEISMQA